jgi:hypothetical protein
MRTFGAWAANARDCQAACDRVDECDDPETAIGAGAVVTMLAAGGLALLRRARRRRAAAD